MNEQLALFDAPEEPPAPTYSREEFERDRFGATGDRLAAQQVGAVTMKALTICQPYAELIARGEKVIENRTWPTSYRGPLLIHAGKSRAWLSDDDHPKANYGVDVRAVPFGAAVAVADLVDCRRLADLPPDLQAHEHANGPWCWVLRNVRRIDPVPMNGAQGLWLASVSEDRHV